MIPLCVLRAFLLALPLWSPMAQAAPRRAAGVRSSIDHGWFTNTLRIELTTTTPDATILYTTNGAEPRQPSAQTYREPIVVSRTTILRAIATRTDLASSTVSTWSYLQPGDLLNQSGTNRPSNWGLREGKPVPADYDMDLSVTRDSGYREGIPAAWNMLPMVSVVLDPANLFDPARGIYANPMETGEAWERAATIEYLPPARGQVNEVNESGFTIDCGVRIQGGWNRRPEESPKHSLRLVFRKRYGEARLRQPLFPGRPTEFATLILRGGNNNSWLHWSGEERQRADYLRDEWMRRTYAAMGRASPRGRMVHVCLNGLYWGIYNLVERPDEHFAAAHLGGAASDYDARNADKILQGDDDAWRALLALIETGVPDAPAFDQVRRWLDVPAFIDYALVNLYGANGDLDGASNWYAARRRTLGGQFVFFVWDGERCLEQVTDDRLAEDAANSPWRILQGLRKNSEFRRQFAARAKAVCESTGPLSPSAAAERYRPLADELRPAIVLESARWGDHRLKVNPYKTGPFERYTPRQHWDPEIRRLLEHYFPARTGAFITQLKAAGLYD